MIQTRIPIMKTLASAITLGTSGSGGREGPIAQIGAGFGSFLATQLELSPRDRRVILAAGMGAGVRAIFWNPLAGALFAGEILYRDADLESDVIVPSAISSIVAYSIYALSLLSEKWFSPLFGEELAYKSRFAIRTASTGGSGICVGADCHLLHSRVLWCAMGVQQNSDQASFQASHRCLPDRCRGICCINSSIRMKMLWQCFLSVMAPCRRHSRLGVGSVFSCYY